MKMERCSETSTRKIQTLGNHASGRVQKKAATFAHPTNDSGWKTLAQRRKRACISTGEQAVSLSGQVKRAMLPEQG